MVKCAYCEKHQQLQPRCPTCGGSLFREEDEEKEQLRKKFQQICDDLRQIQHEDVPDMLEELLEFGREQLKLRLANTDEDGRHYVVPVEGGGLVWVALPEDVPDLPCVERLKGCIKGD